MLRAGWRSRGSARLLAAGTPALAVAFVAVGFVSVEHYGRNYWLYRGFPPPTDPAYVTQTGTQEQLAVESAALGGRAQQVDVYLPPGYAEHPERRYPVMYLLHGFPGRPLAFVLTVRAGVVEDELAAKDEGQPMILVMPFGSTGTFTDKEWADGVHTGEGWATFVARDVVHTIDSTYRTRTIPLAAGRAQSPASRRAATAPSTSPSTIPVSSTLSRVGRATSAHRGFPRSSAPPARGWPPIHRSRDCPRWRTSSVTPTCSSGSTRAPTIRSTVRTASSAGS